jgi:hypothetical protein
MNEIMEKVLTDEEAREDEALEAIIDEQEAFESWE